ncbi:MAG: glutamate--tRNA ligase, partial [Planctomycetota bacterium]
PFTKDAIEAALTPVIEAHGGIKKAGQLIRVSATGTNVSPELFATCALVGKDRLLARFDAAKAKAESPQEG